MDLMIFTGKKENFFGKTIQLLQGFQLKSPFFLKSNSNYTLLHTAKLSMHSGLSCHGLWSFAFHGGPY